MNDIRDNRLKILIITSFLVILGLIFLLSSGTMVALSLGKQELYFFQKQLISVLVGCFIMYSAYRVPLNTWRKLTPVFYFATLIMLVTVFAYRPINGAHRWVLLPGFSLQPSELAKFTVILYLAHYLDKKEDKLKDFAKGFLPASIMLGLIGALILMEPDFGTTFLLITVLLAMFIIGGASIMHIGGVLGFIAPILIAGLMMGYRKARLLSFLDPLEDRYGVGYQLVQSLAAICSGGLFGKGLGNSSQKLHFLPEAHTDFIFAIISEETGLWGAFGIMILFGLLFYVLIKVAKSHEDKFKRLLTFGMAYTMIIQAILHVGVVSGALPTKGIGLPYMSYGGSSMIFALFMTGVLLRSAEEAQGQKQ
ncbi:MAG: putative lipid II flippase FtsW [Deferribacterales bacterium]